jgi:hypothetical protein
MSNFARERLDSAWYRGLQIPQAVLLNIDEKTKKAVSGTGGTWAPSSAINLGGAGLELQCGMQLTLATAAPSSGNAFRFGDDDYFNHAALVSRTIDDSPLQILAHHTLGREARPWAAVATTTTPALRTKRAGAFLRIPIRIPDGSRLSTVAISFKVGQSHANVPATLPSARVVRMSADGLIEQYPNAATTLYEPEGWVSPALPVSGVAWYAAGALQTLTLTYSYLLAPVADTSVYSYAVEWREEEGTGAFTDAVGNYLVHLKQTVYSADLRPY